MLPDHLFISINFLTKNLSENNNKIQKKKTIYTTIFRNVLQRILFYPTEIIFYYSLAQWTMNLSIENILFSI